MTHVLAIDLGTGGPKVALVGLDGQIAGSEVETTELILGDGGKAEQDPADWWRAIDTATLRLLERELVPRAAIDAVAVTSQWSGTVAVDAQGKPLMNAIIWMDSRGSAEIRKVTSGALKVQGYDVRRLKSWIQRTGGIPSHSGKDPVAHILWIKANLPDVYDATHTFLEPCDYLNLRLSGRTVSSHDAITLHWITDNRDRNNIVYDDELIAAFGLDRKRLPELVPSASVIGTVTAEISTRWGLTPTTKVVTATGDVHSAAVGSGAVADYAGHLYIGTSSWLSCHVPWKKTDLLRNQAALPSALPGRYFIVNEHETAGACIDHLIDEVIYADDALGTPKPDDAYARVEALATEVPAGANGVVYTPWLNGERTPVDDHTIRAGWQHIGLANTRADLVRATYEGVAFNSRWLLEAVEKFTKHRLDTLNFIGGGALSTLWCQIHADVLDRDINQMAEPRQANVRGAALLASIALGHARVDSLAAEVPVERTFHPDPANKAIYDALFDQFTAIYKADKPIHAKLEGIRHAS
jgi:xylulokinase